jgi:tRNA-dihydrouridine synthase
MEEYYGPKYGIGPMRGHMMYYIKGFRDAKRFRADINSSNSFGEIKDTVARYFMKELESVA